MEGPSRVRSLTPFEDAVDNGLGEILVVQEAAKAAARLASAFAKAPVGQVARRTETALTRRASSGG